MPSGAPARWGVKDTQLPDEVLVHNLEHGGIGFHYDCPDSCPNLEEDLRSIPPAGFSQFIVAPYPDMPQKIAITSWRHVMYLDEFDEDKIRAFIDEYLDRAPESIPTNPF